MRDALKLKTGDRLEFIIESEGRVILRPATSDLIALDGLLDRSSTPAVSVEAMDEAVEEAVSQSFRESS